MKGRYFVCFWLLVLGIVRVDCHLRHKLRNMLGRDYRRVQQNVPVQQGSYEVYRGSVEQLGSFNAEWVCTNAKNDKLIIGSEQMDSIRGMNSYPGENRDNAWDGGVYIPPQAHYPPQQSQGNAGFSYQPETPQQYYPPQQLPPNSQQGHQNPQQLSPQSQPFELPSHSSSGQDQPKPGSSGVPAVTQTTTHTNSPSTDDSNILFDNFDWTAYVTLKPVLTAAEEKEIVNTGEGILQPRVIN